jgi:hypothetical protein
MWGRGALAEPAARLVPARTTVNPSARRRRMGKR